MMTDGFSGVDMSGVLDALQSSKYTGGSTHNFYLYPARFSPDIARAVVEAFSEPGDWVLDPFMGGGTAIVEGLALGRAMIGVDLNALAHFIAGVRTRPLSQRDEERILAWARIVAETVPRTPVRGPARIRNLPLTVNGFISGALARVEQLPFPRQRAFARGILLRLGQWALDCRDHGGTSRRKLGEKLPDLAGQMLKGLREFVDLCRTAGVQKSEIAKRRLLLWRNAEALHQEPQLYSMKRRPRLIFTSPPYPCVHVLYHRWQVQGRKETPAPYWIAHVPDGYNASYYTGGSRTPTGERNYFSMIKSVFSSMRQVLASDGMVVQLVGFADIDAQLPMYLTAMDDAGFEMWKPLGSGQNAFWRQVPHRKWHAKLQGAVDTSSEVLLFHRPRRSRRS